MLPSKWENLFRCSTKLVKSLQNHLHWICDRVNILCKYIRIFIHTKQPNIQTQPKQKQPHPQHEFHY